MRLPVIMLIVLYVVAIAIDYYILCDIRYRGNNKPKREMFPFRDYMFTPSWLWIYFTILCLALLTVAISLPRTEGVSISPIATMLFIFITIYLGKLGYIIGSAIGRVPGLWRGRRRDTRLWLGLSFSFLFVFTLLWGFFVARRHLEVKEVTVNSPILPKNFDGYRIVQFSDLHTDTWGEDTVFISQLVDCINSLHPDMIVFTGDIVSRRTSEIYPFVDILSRLKAPDGVYSILGNHDYGDYFHWPSMTAKQANIDELKEIQHTMGWKMLNNERDTIRRGNEFFVIAGVENWGEPPFKQYGDLSKALPDSASNKDTFILLLSHNPMHWHESVRYNPGVDMTLSGHTHAMQTQFSIGDMRWSPAKWRYPEWSGLYSHPNGKGHNSLLYVNTGAGEVGMPARIGTAFPEVTLITLKSTPSPHQQ